MPALRGKEVTLTPPQIRALMNVHMQGIPYARTSMVTRYLVARKLIEATGESRAGCELYRVTNWGMLVIDSLDEKWKAQEERSR
jgi:hypothetical protein